MVSSTRAGASRRASARPTTRASAAKHLLSANAARAPQREGDVLSAEPGRSVLGQGTKRKKRDFDSDEGGEGTNIRVVVRCRGRNEREVRENSAVAVNTDGVRGKQVELRMRADILNNKTYDFDRVFSQAADQSMVFDDTVKPILDEMLAGYNCTIFAYGQTGTGKTYTMSGDMTDTLGILSDGAGIIPRVLQELFNKLGLRDTENCVKCSFIELYNEELRDLLSADDAPRLKLYDDASRRGHASTLVQGMEEKHIQNAIEGIKALQDGSSKRQVAATNYNDRSSRSHTIFTITAYVKQTNEHGIEDLVSAGKLNLVDLAGSENIQRSGAENKRAAEAGMINKSLLTLGRVINALVDRSSHIPYRESKLTRLLQDSLGGQTKTCIIATVSPAKSNLEETMSTLDYAFRAKNIRNKPQLHSIPKNTLLKDLVGEIEKLKNELISTRQRNGVYLPNDMYEEMVAQSESRRVAIQDQGAKMETLETNLRNKAHELFSLISSFTGLKKDHEGTKAQLAEIERALNQTEVTLSATRQHLAEEKHLRNEYQTTEEKLATIGDELISKLRQTVNDITALHAKDKRKSDLQSINRTVWGVSRAQVADVTSVVEGRVLELQEEQQEYISSTSKRLKTFVHGELDKLSMVQAKLNEQLDHFVESKGHLLNQNDKSKGNIDEVLQGVNGVCNAIQRRVGSSLQLISRTTEKVTADVLNEMAHFHTQLHDSYTCIGKDFKSLFEHLVKHIATQRAESDNLRRQLDMATTAIALHNADTATYVQEALEEERRQAAEDRQKLLTHISNLVGEQGDAQEARLVDRTVQVQKRLAESNRSLERAVLQHSQSMDAWGKKEGQLLEEAQVSHDQVHAKLKDDCAKANELGACVQSAARSMHTKTAQAVDEQRSDLDMHVEALDGFVHGGKTESAASHEVHAQSVQALAGAVEQLFADMLGQVETSSDGVKKLGEEMETDTKELCKHMGPLEALVCEPLANLRKYVSETALQEYQHTGATPPKCRHQYPTRLPRTEVHSIVTCTIDDDAPRAAMADEDVYANDGPLALLRPAGTGTTSSSPRLSSISSVRDKNHLGLKLREVDPNVPMNLATSATWSGSHPSTLPLTKRTTRSSSGGWDQDMMVQKENPPVYSLLTNHDEKHLG